VYIEPAEQKFETKTIEINAMTYDTKRDEHGRITEDQLTADFPHDQEVASQLLYQIMTKFNSCTEVERRKITRSDAEFMYLMGYVIARRCGFKNLEEAFDIDESRINIPRIKRGNELMWSGKGDPEPEVSDEDQMFNSKINELAHIIIDKLYEYILTCMQN
jgi:hypothetical protein